MQLHSDPFVAELIARQERDGLNDTAFSERLGVNLSVWWRIKRGERRLSKGVLDGALRTYPDLAIFYAQNLTIGISEDASRHEQEVA